MPHQPTRLPYGLSYVNPFTTSDKYTIPSGKTTPDVGQGTYFVTPASGITITNFINAERGKIIYLYCNTGGAIVLQNSAGGIRFQNIVYAISNSTLKYSSTGGNLTMLEGETLSFLYDGTSWSMAAPRVVDSTMI